MVVGRRRTVQQRLDRGRRLHRPPRHRMHQRRLLRSHDLIRAADRAGRAHPRATQSPRARATVTADTAGLGRARSPIAGRRPVTLRAPAGRIVGRATSAMTMTAMISCTTAHCNRFGSRSVTPTCFSVGVAASDPRSAPATRRPDACRAIPTRAPRCPSWSMLEFWRNNPLPTSVTACRPAVLLHQPDAVLRGVAADPRWWPVDGVTAVGQLGRAGDGRGRQRALRRAHAVGVRWLPRHRKTQATQARRSRLRRRPGQPGSTPPVLAHRRQAARDAPPPMSCRRPLALWRRPTS